MQLYTVLPGLLFVALVLSLFLFIVIGGYRLGVRSGLAPAVSRNRAGLVGLGLLAWFFLTALLAARGFFLETMSMPPRFLLLIVPPILLLLTMMLLPITARLLDLVSPATLVGWQSFRVVMELILWLLFLQGTVAELMTFEGRNVDILVGLSAPLVALFCFYRPRLPESVALWWNGFGILILLNVVIHGILSAPVPFRQFVTDPPNTFLFHPPYCWLPAFVVPVAMGLHLLSIKQLLRRRSSDRTPASAAPQRVRD